MGTASRARGVRCRSVALLALASGAALAACSLEKDPDLALACEVRKCECLPAQPSVFSKPEGEEVLWRENGSAYCPEGYVLRLVDE